MSIVETTGLQSILKGMLTETVTRIFLVGYPWVDEHKSSIWVLMDSVATRASAISLGVSIFERKRRSVSLVNLSEFWGVVLKLRLLSVLSLRKGNSVPSNRGSREG